MQGAQHDQATTKAALQEMRAERVGLEAIVTQSQVQLAEVEATLQSCRAQASADALAAAGEIGALRQQLDSLKLPWKIY